MRMARNAINGLEARTRSAIEKFRQDARGRHTQGTFDKPLARVTVIFDHVFGKPLTWTADKFTYTFDPLLTASKGASKGRLCYPPFTGVHRWVNTAFTAFDVSGKGAFKDDLWCASKIIKSVQRSPLLNLSPYIWCAVKAIFRAVMTPPFLFPSVEKAVRWSYPFRSVHFSVFWKLVQNQFLSLTSELFCSWNEYCFCRWLLPRSEFFC